MKSITRILTTTGILFVALALGTFIVRQSFASRAELIQRVEVDKVGGELFGISEPTPIGSPQEMIISDPAAFLPDQGQGKVKRVNEAYLREHGIYPLQLKTVDFAVSKVRIGCLAAAVIAFLSSYWLSHRRPTQGASAPPK